jgi:hypothetical protein
VGKRYTKQTVVQKVSVETGEVHEFEVEKVFIAPTSSEPFYMTYIKNLAPLFQLSSAIEIKVLIKLCCLADFNTGRVDLSALLRKEICTELEVSPNHFTNCISNLVKKELISGTRGAYVINANVFWKGDEKTRQELLKAGAKIAISIKIDESDVAPENAMNPS